MAEITAASVGKLREMTGAGLMDCKKALTEAKGDLSAAGDILRKRGAATAVSKASREAREGVIAQHIAPGGRLGVLVEIKGESMVMAATDTVVCLNHHVCCTGRPEAVRLDPAYLALFGAPRTSALAVYTHHHDHVHDAAHHEHGHSHGPGHTHGDEPAKVDHSHG